MPLKEKRWLIIIIPILMGIMILAILIQRRSGPEQVPPTEQARSVRVIEVPAVTVVPRAIGYGSVAPGMIWEAVAEVSGRIIAMHPRLKNGEILVADSVLLRIDPTDYELALAQVEANIEAAEAQLAELKVREDNVRASLEIEEQALRLGENELERLRRLVAQGTVTRSAFEQEERTVLGQRQSVQSLNNTLNLIPAERRRLEAQLARYQAELESARLNLERTVIRMPFDGRIAAVNVERTQFVRQGEILTVVDGIAVAEIAVQIPLSRMRTLIQPEDTFPLADLNNLEAVKAALGLSARVRLRIQDFQVEWQARFARLSDIIHPQTRTVGVIVAVDEPYRQAQPGIRPPLIKGMFVEVELRGRPQADRLVIPRTAVHSRDEVLVVNGENRLEKRTVEVGLTQPGFATVTVGLKAGDRVVVSDLIPAIEGMLLKPQVDQAAQAALVSEAQGEGEVR